MFEHALRLIWNRRRANALVIIEVAAAFPVLFVVAALTLHAWGKLSAPARLPLRQPLARLRLQRELQ